MFLALALLLMAASLFGIRQYLPSWSSTSTREASQTSHESSHEQAGKAVDAETESSGQGIIREETGAGTRDTVPESKAPNGNAPSPETTPKASAKPDTNMSVPSFSLDTGDDSDEEEDSLPPPSFPALNSAQRASAAPSLRLPSQASLPRQPSKRPGPSMPPPPKPISKPQTYTNSTTSLRIPTSGPLPNRGPVPNRGPGQGSSLGLPVAGSMKTPSARQKVLLDPGHSPLDWANLVKSGKNLSGVNSLIRVTPAQLKYNNGRKGKPAWSVWQGKVYNITPYLPFHPGGKGELMRGAGKDGTKLFMDVHPWVNWDNMLSDCVVGILVGDNDAVEKKESSLDDMD